MNIDRLPFHIKTERPQNPVNGVRPKNPPPKQDDVIDKRTIFAATVDEREEKKIPIIINSPEPQPQPQLQPLPQSQTQLTKITTDEAAKMKFEFKPLDLSKLSSYLKQ